MKQVYLLLPILLSGCANLYETPSDRTAHAKVSFVKGYIGGGSTVAIYAVETSSSCSIDKQASIAKLGPVHKKPMIKRVPVDEPISLLATFQKYTTKLTNDVRTPVNLDIQTTCFSRVTFVPEEGRSYRAHLVERTKYDCDLEFVDETTSTTPIGAVITDGVMCFDNELSK